MYQLLLFHFRNLTIKSKAFIHKIVHIIIRKGHITIFINLCHIFFVRRNVVMRYKQYLNNHFSIKFNIINFFRNIQFASPVRATNTGLDGPISEINQE